MASIEPTDEEKERIEHVAWVSPDGAERESWNNAKASHPDTTVELDIHKANVVRIQAAIKGYEGVAGSRKWFEPLMKIFTPELLKDDEEE